MYWLFNQNRIDVNGSERESISWEQNRNFKGVIGDSLIFFDFGNDISYFTYHYEILTVYIEELKIRDQVAQKNIIKLEIALIEDFGSAKEIRDYIYSFPRVIHFSSNLYKHFNRKYYRINELEFNAIVKDEIFETRTTLGVILNSMHIEHRKSFISELMEEQPDVIKNKYKHQVVLSLLRRYLEHAVFVPAKQLQDAYKNLSEIVGDEIIKSVSFGSSNILTETDNVSRQVEIINQYLYLIEESIDEMNADSVVNIKYDNYYKNFPLPIDLNG